MTLIADKDFAGFKAGENITANVLGYQKGNDATAILDYVFPSDYLRLPNEGGYYLPSYGVTIRIPLEGRCEPAVQPRHRRVESQHQGWDRNLARD